ncbi:hypothetical protein LMG27177_06946 [Paraburkholderia fynbosensis]|uniref:Uncharacterized protein n=1 Tax=Paraburkholderia fynbosensis TaxID=1200993 RepID=A0A6J5H388_9BURK|nr:hypothetical protein LMG27177_06946 [Paraburkholderia fynbosensis]
MKVAFKDESVAYLHEVVLNWLDEALGGKLKTNA